VTITVVRGDLLTAEVEALVNAVNTVGVMGKGLALAFRQAYPAMYRDYRQAAQEGRLVVGRMHVWPTGAEAGPRYVINFPTKRHWRSASRLADIEAGLADLVASIDRLGLRSLAVPALGCGHGGLPWSDVEPLIRSSLGHRPAVRVLLYPPA
jgi:O-acetyl-ADP-ribose deacetylase (regulator of RNase III)